MRIALIVLGVVAGLNIMGLIINSLFFKNELKSMRPYGQIVSVAGGNMHIHSMGTAGEIIVLLPGLGVSLPSADFGPLMRKLRESFRVVAIEYFGTGFSDQASTPRTNENYMNEIRSALTQAGFQPPYILMPHSASGIYAEYYATKHPEEISAIIMLDTTSTAVVKDMPGIINFVYPVAKFQQATGLTRLPMQLVPDPKKLENGYTEREKADYLKFNFHVINDTFIDQSIRLTDNIKEVNALPFSSVPVLKLIASQSVKMMAKEYKGDGMEYQREHLRRLGPTVEHRVIDATHFIYHTRVDEIADVTREFLSRVR